MTLWRISAGLIALSICALPIHFAFAEESILQHIDEDAGTSALVSDFLKSHRVKRYGIVIVDVQSLRETITAFEQPSRQETCCVLNFKLFPDVEIALHTYQVWCIGVIGGYIDRKCWSNRSSP